MLMAIFFSNFSVGLKSKWFYKSVICRQIDYTYSFVNVMIYLTIIAFHLDLPTIDTKSWTFMWGTDTPPQTTVIMESDGYTVHGSRRQSQYLKIVHACP